VGGSVHGGSERRDRRRGGSGRLSLSEPDATDRRIGIQLPKIPRFASIFYHILAAACAGFTRSPVHPFTRSPVHPFILHPSSFRAGDTPTP
jgi:hypothetical protein